MFSTTHFVVQPCSFVTFTLNTDLIYSLVFAVPKLKHLIEYLKDRDLFDYRDLKKKRR